MTREEALGHIRAAYTDLHGITDPLVTEGMTFEEMNLDSLEVVELALTVEDRTGCKMPGEQVDDAKKVGDFVDVMVKG